MLGWTYNCVYCLSQRAVFTISKWWNIYFESGVHSPRPVTRRLRTRAEEGALNLGLEGLTGRTKKVPGYGVFFKGLGPYAWVQGRRATSKVTATSGDRLTNRYAWATGRLTRRAYLGVNLSLRVPPCKHYPEEVTELKMAALILLRYRQRRLLRRNRIFGGQDRPFRQI